MTIYKPTILLAMATPSDRDQLDVDMIAKSFTDRPIPCTVIEHTTPSRLYDALISKQHNILHFVGHGSPKSLSLETPEGKESQLSLQGLQGMLHNSSIRLAILYACHTFPNPLQIPSIGLRAEGTTDGAIIFARGFYGGRPTRIPVEKNYKVGKRRVATAVHNARKQGLIIKGQPLPPETDHPTLSQHPARPRHAACKETQAARPGLGSPSLCRMSTCCHWKRDCTGMRLAKRKGASPMP